MERGNKMPQIWDTECRADPIERDNLLMDSRRFLFAA